MSLGIYAHNGRGWGGMGMGGSCFTRWQNFFKPGVGQDIVWFFCKEEFCLFNFTLLVHSSSFPPVPFKHEVIDICHEHLNWLLVWLVIWGILFCLVTLKKKKKRTLYWRNRLFVFPDGRVGMGWGLIWNVTHTHSTHTPSPSHFFPPITLMFFFSFLLVCVCMI